MTDLLKGAEERLESGKVPDQLEDSQDPGDTDQTKNLSGLADDVELGQVVDQEGDEVGQDGEQVDLSENQPRILKCDIYSLSRQCDHKIWSKYCPSFLKVLPNV